MDVLSREKLGYKLLSRNDETISMSEIKYAYYFAFLIV